MGGKGGSKKKENEMPGRLRIQIRTSMKRTIKKRSPEQDGDRKAATPTNEGREWWLRP